MSGGVGRAFSGYAVQLLRVCVVLERIVFSLHGVKGTFDTAL